MHAVKLTDEGIGNGYLTLKLMGGKSFRVYGGPYAERPETMRGVCMAKEHAHRPADVRVPTVDFGVPRREDLLIALDKVVDFLRRREQVYVGCMGGIGRTGTFLALLAKLFGEKEPIKYVREVYLAHAVETPMQEGLVETFTFPKKLQYKVMWLKAAGLIPFRESPLNHKPISI